MNPRLTRDQADMNPRINYYLTSITGDREGYILP